MTKKSFTPYDHLNAKQRRVFHEAYRGIKRATSDKEAMEYEKVADMLFAISIRNYRNAWKAEKEKKEEKSMTYFFDNLKTKEDREFFYNLIRKKRAKGIGVEQIADAIEMSVLETKTLIEEVEREERMQMAKHSLEVEGFQVEDHHIDLVRRVLFGELSQEEFDRLALEAARKKGENE